MPSVPKMKKTKMNMTMKRKMKKMEQGKKCQRKRRKTNANVKRKLIKPQRKMKQREGKRRERETANWKKKNIYVCLILESLLVCKSDFFEHLRPGSKKKQLSGGDRRKGTTFLEVISQSWETKRDGKRENGRPKTLERKKGSKSCPFLWKIHFRGRTWKNGKTMRINATVVSNKKRRKIMQRE